MNTAKEKQKGTEKIYTEKIIYKHKKKRKRERGIGEYILEKILFRT